MLGKLMKYEWKSTYKIEGILLICVAAVTLMGCVAIGTMPFIDSVNMTYDEGAFLSGMIAMTAFMTFGLYILALVGVMYACMIYLGVRFYKSMYTDEGYLTHTLPVTVHQTLISKLLVAGLWYIINGAAIVLSVLILGYTAFCVFADIPPAEAAGMFAEGFGALMNQMPAEWTAAIVHLLVTLGFTVLVSPFCTMMILFGSITMGQLFTKYRGLMAIVCYIGVGIINGILSSIIATPLSMRFMFTGNEQDILRYYTSIYDFSGIWLLIVSAVMYAVAYLILTRKFDIE